MRVVLQFRRLAENPERLGEALPCDLRLLSREVHVAPRDLRNAEFEQAFGPQRHTDHERRELVRVCPGLVTRADRIDSTRRQGDPTSLLHAERTSGTAGRAKPRLASPSRRMFSRISATSARRALEARAFP